MRIGVLPSFDPAGGGVYQYGMSFLDALTAEPDTADQYVLFASDRQHPLARACEAALWDVRDLPRPTPGHRAVAAARIHAALGTGNAQRLARGLRRLVLPPRPPAYPPSEAEEVGFVCDAFRAARIDLMLFPQPELWSFQGGVPYVMAVHDLQHRLQPEFPEVSAGGEWEWREFLFGHGIRGAACVIVDSEVGKEDVLEFYGGKGGISEDRVKILPFVPPPYLTMVATGATDVVSVRRRYRLPERFLFYPAQFWPHKNHLALIRALALIRDRGGAVPALVLVGSHSGTLRSENFKNMLDTAHALHVSDHIRYLGYLSEADMAAVFSAAAGLVMPTFFGPTNIPILEAWHLGCPVLSSDIRGIREQVGDAGILVDPRSIESIADGIERLYTDDDLRAELIVLGRGRTASYTFEDFHRELGLIVEEAKARAQFNASLRDEVHVKAV